jgi:hypothetical protein
MLRKNLVPIPQYLVNYCITLVLNTYTHIFYSYLNKYEPVIT